MRESILTIPISEIFEPKCGCPFCRMRDTLEDRCVEYIMGAAMMEPDVREQTNQLGFCKTHFEKMLQQKNRLSIALMLQSHLNEINSSIISKKRLFSNSKGKTAKISELNNSCFVCSKIEWGMKRLLVTFFEMFEKSNEFKKLLSEQEMLCLNHYEMLLSLSSSMISKKALSEFEAICTSLLQKHLAELINDVTHFCNMYDYRNSGKNADWGNSKDSIERTVKFLTTR